MEGSMQGTVFFKVHGLGNDFIVFDCVHPAFAPTADGRAHLGLPTEDLGAATLPPDTAIRLCDRHFGIGADGVLLVLPSTSGAARMRIINADGSVAEMCGNGIRCVAQHLAVHHGLPHDVLEIETDAGRKACAIVRGPDGRVDGVRVAMGPPALRVTDAWVPLATVPAPARAQMAANATRAYDIGSHTLAGLALSMGNPHFVSFWPEVTPALAEHVGQALVYHPDFTEGTNVELCAPQGQGALSLIVFERGVGLTLACGTGAAATAVAACLTGRAAAGSAVSVHLPGGRAAVTVSEGYDEVWLEGPAVEVFRGELVP